jgi:hypothetical protein
MEMTQILLHAKNIPWHLWRVAISIVVHILNWTINSQLGTRIPI